MFDTIIHLTTALVPSLGVLTFLLLHRRQEANNRHERLRLRQEHCQAIQEQQTQRVLALAQAGKAVAPALVPIVEKLLAKLDDDPVPPSAAALMDHDLLDELRRRVDENDFEGLRPGQVGEGPLDEFLEHLWARGVFSRRSEIPVS